MLTSINTASFKPAPLGVDPTSILAVIPALNEARHIETCIRSLMQGSPLLRLVPLTVADGGSTDETQAIVKRLTAEFPNLRLIENPKRLKSAAMNLAAGAHSGPQTRWLVRCDAHSVYPQNFILHVAEALQRTGAASVVIPMDAVGETCFEKGNAWVVDTLLGSGGSAHRGGRKSHYVDHGHHAGFDISWFRKVGGYDETFSHNEDAEYDHRLGAAGGKVWMDADIRIEYVPRGSIRALARQYFNYGKGRARNLRKHNRQLKPRQAVPIFALVGSVGGLLAGISFLPALALPIGYLSILAGASLAIAVQRRSVCGLFAGVAAGTMHMAWAAGFIWESVSANR
ncbi:putative glycosyl transferase ExoA [Hyphomonas neptunium ATCC 15444]|uniref:Putative glycosyl transferase ExoA n=2 Tax=Hyphomonas neptunium TaxID=81032 RepID=Q0BYV7_HYPNA|nr:putative glycosyl transferase ExoA [Hyphomonas neptunium ATCC 15444]